MDDAIMPQKLTDRDLLMNMYDIITFWGAYRQEYMQRHTYVCISVGHLR